MESSRSSHNVGIDKPSAEEKPTDDLTPSHPVSESHTPATSAMPPVQSAPEPKEEPDTSAIQPSTNDDASASPGRAANDPRSRFETDS